MLLKPAYDSTEHTSSYYAASASRKTNYPELQDDLKTDVVVVGGGFSGVATALELSELGYEVILLEANRIGWGASGRNGGQLIGGYGNNPSAFRHTIGLEGVAQVQQMGVECVDIVSERIEKYKIDCDLKWGWCEVALKRRHLKAYKNWSLEESAIQLLDINEVREFVNSELYLGGYYREDWGHLHPLNLCLGEAKAAEALGTQIFEQSKVTAIKYSTKPVISTTKGSVQARFAVLCGNAYMTDLVPYLDARVLPSVSCIIATEPLSESQINQTLPRDVAVCDSRTALDYYRLTADKRLLMGGLSNYTGLEPTDVGKVMRNHMVKVFPCLKLVGIDYAWSGKIGVSIRRMPQVGFIKGSNVLYATGYSGHGVAPTHMSGRVLAEAVDGNPHRMNILSKMYHLPWPGGKIFRRPFMAAGMMFYKALDML